MIAFVVLAQLSALQAPPPSRPAADIVVTGNRLRDEATLAECETKPCSVETYAAAALAVSRRQFVDGEYERARSTLTRALARHRGDARAHPLPVAALWREKGRVDSHLGEYELYRSSQLQTLSALRAGLDRDDPRLLSGLIELGDSETHLGRRPEARRFYKAALQQAERSGRKPIMAVAQLRLAGLAGLQPGQTVTAGTVRTVTDILAPLTASPDPALAAFAAPARLVVARVAERAGDKDAVQAWARSLPPEIRLRPILVSAAPIRTQSFGENNCQDDLASSPMRSASEPGRNRSELLDCGKPHDRRSMTNVAGQWIDVRFRIEPTGMVRRVEVERRSSQYQGDWADRVLDSVRSRRYMVLPNAEVSPQLDRIERFTMTAPYDQITGDMIRSRTRSVTIERVDLTPDQLRPTAG